MADGSGQFEGARPLSIVGFAGGGGSSVAVKQALGVAPDLAMNHWMTAVLAHQRHFPQTEHWCADIFDVDPRAWRPGEKIGFAWFSPDCTDFSKAKGKAPKSERIRGLIWSTMPWARFRRPDVMIIENVEEFEQAGPVYRCPDDWRAKGVVGEVGQPIKALRGQTFQRWVRKVRKIGGTVEWRVINAADFGAPTTRKRIYVIVRFDGEPIIWPERTHAPRKDAARLGLLPWVGACTVIDWKEDCPSIFLDEQEVDQLRRETGKRVQRPLVSATQSRIARGLERYVIGSAAPFIVPITQRKWGGDRAHDVRDPLKTVMSSRGGDFALGDAKVALLSSVAHGDGRDRAGLRAWDLEDPTRTQTGQNDKALVAGSLVRTNFHSSAATTGVRDVEEPTATATGDGGIGLASAYLVPSYSERAGQAPRAADVEEPLPTPVPGGNQGRPVAVHLQRQFGRGVGSDAVEPVGAITGGGGGKTLACAAYLGRQFGSTVSGRDLEEPHPVVMTDGGGGKSQIIAATLDSYYSEGSVGADPGEPARTATGKARHSLITAWLEQANTGMVGHDLRTPMSTIVAGGGSGSGWGPTQRLIETRLELDGGPIGRRDKVLAFLWQHFGLPTEAEWLAPAGTLEARKKFGLVLIDDQVWMIVDIGLRMLLPKELAGAMGLPPQYDLATNFLGEPVSKTNQTQMIGNMVSPPPAAALIAANCPDLIQGRAA